MHEDVGLCQLVVNISELGQTSPEGNPVSDPQFGRQLLEGIRLRTAADDPILTLRTVAIEAGEGLQPQVEAFPMQKPPYAD